MVTERDSVIERHGVWLHAVTRGVVPDKLRGLTGVGGTPVRAVPAAGLVAAVSTVDLAEFGEEPLRRHLEDLTWLEAVARTHHAVADAVGRLGPVVPARLATVHLDEARVAAALAEHSADFHRALDRVDGRVEWGVKAYAVPAPASTPTGNDVGGGPGRAYLQRRRARLTATEVAEQAAAADADRLHAAVAELAEASCRHPPQNARLSGTADWMVLNGAYLVADHRVDEFADTVRDLVPRHPGIRVQLTGPWPPYSFAVVGEASS